MSKVMGKLIKFSEAETLRANAVRFQSDSAIKNAISAASVDKQVFYNNLDCAFIFDKDSLLTMMAKIMTVPDSGLVMMMGASNDPERLNRPTLSVFACNITKTDIPGVDSTYQIIHPASKADTEGVEHPGLVDLNNGGGVVIDRGVIKLLNL